MIIQHSNCRISIQHSQTMNFRNTIHITKHTQKVITCSDIINHHPKLKMEKTTYYLRSIVINTHTGPMKHRHSSD